MTVRQKNAFLTAPPKQDVVRRAPDVTLIGQTAANYHIKPGKGQAPAQEGTVDTCWRSLPGQNPFLSTKGSALIFLLHNRSPWTPELPLTHPAIASKGPGLGAP